MEMEWSMRRSTCWAQCEMEGYEDERREKVSVEVGLGGYGIEVTKGLLGIIIRESARL
jgi:hypothetical protein